jgi:hypothetical protein
LCLWARPPEGPLTEPPKGLVEARVRVCANPMRKRTCGHGWGAALRKFRARSDTLR